MNPNTLLLGMATQAVGAQSNKELPVRSEADVNFLREALHSIQGIEDHQRNLVLLLNNEKSSAIDRAHVLSSIDDDVEQYDNALSYVKKGYHKTLFPILEDSVKYTPEEQEIVWHIFTNCAQNHQKNQEILVNDNSLHRLLMLSVVSETEYTTYPSLMAIGSTCRGSAEGFHILTQFTSPKNVSFLQILLNTLENSTEAVSNTNVCTNKRASISALRLYFDCLPYVSHDIDKLVLELCKTRWMKDVFNPHIEMDFSFRNQVIHGFFLGVYRTLTIETTKNHESSSIALQHSLGELFRCAPTEKITEKISNIVGELGITTNAIPNEHIEDSTIEIVRFIINVIVND